MVASATTSVETSMILDSRADVIAAPFDPADPTTYNTANTVNTYDSLGNMHSVTMYYTKTGVNQWSVHAGLNGASSVSAPQTLNFNANGTMVGYADSNFQFAMTNGANNLDFNLDMTGTMQFGTDFSQNALTQNGYTAGALVGISVDKNGDLVGAYANEQKVVLGALELATFRNPEGLKPLGDNVWASTTQSGQALVGTAGMGLYGDIEAGALEGSNVDMTRELVNMIVAQRAFQANAQTGKTQDEVLQQAVNLR
jgi:flagellar hook protein FlgE